MEAKDGNDPEMQEIWGLQRLWGHPLGRNTSVGNQNIYNGTWMEYDDAVSRLHVVIAYCYGNSSNSANLRFGADGGENGREKDSGRHMWVKDHLV